MRGILASGEKGNLTPAAIRCARADSDSEERTDLAEPFAAQAVVRHRLCDDCPVLGRVTAHAQVSEFVGDQVVEDRGRGHHGAPVEAQRAVRCATRPAAALVPDEDRLRPDAEETCNPVDARRQLQRGALRDTMPRRQRAP